MLLSPARLDGKRGRMLLDPSADFPLARKLRSPEGAPLGTLFGFVSGLYFRGKASYAALFARPYQKPPGELVICAGGGLCPLDEPVTLARLKGWAGVAIHEHNPHFTAPLQRHAAALLDRHEPSTRFVLLGSIATHKYVAPLLEVFGNRLLYPTEFVGRGDMSRGALLLGAVRERRELDYQPVSSSAAGYQDVGR